MTRREAVHCGLCFLLGALITLGIDHRPQANRPLLRPFQPQLAETPAAETPATPARPDVAAAKPNEQAAPAPTPDSAAPAPASVPMPSSVADAGADAGPAKPTQVETSAAQAGSRGAASQTGQMLPFHVLHAGLDRAGPDAALGANISVAVSGGNPADWAATAAFLARKALVNGAQSASVQVIAESPWGDLPPTDVKTLATAYNVVSTAGLPVPFPLSVTSAKQPIDAPTLEYYQVDEALSELRHGDMSPDEFEKRDARQKQRARRIVIDRNHLPPDWQPAPTAMLGISGDPQDGSRIGVANEAMAEGLAAPVVACLSVPRRATPPASCDDKATRPDPLADTGDKPGNPPTKPSPAAKP